MGNEKKNADSLKAYADSCSCGSEVFRLRTQDGVDGSTFYR